MLECIVLTHNQKHNILESIAIFQEIDLCGIDYITI